MAETVSQTESIPQVLVEIQTGEGLTLAAAGKLFPGHRGGKSVNPSTVFRWVTQGVKNPLGALVKLEAVRVGSRWLTSRPAIGRFATALTASISPAPPAEPIRSPSHRRVAAAIAKLEAAGA